MDKNILIIGPIKSLYELIQNVHKRTAAADTNYSHYLNIISNLSNFESNILDMQ